MAESSPERLDSQSNRRSRIHGHVKVNIPNNLHQQASRNTEATKFNAIVKQLEESDENGHRRRNNINKFSPLYVLDDR